MKDVSVIVTAAGSGSRFGTRKQFLELKPGVRLVDVAVESASDISDNVALALPAGYEWDGRPVSTVVTGGQSRLDSVAAGLSSLPDDQEIVVVHDAAHPMAPKKAFLDVIEAVRNGADAAVPVLPLADVVKRIDRQERLSTVGRDGLGLAQVPMAFSFDALRAAHEDEKERSPEVWEDSMLIEIRGGQVIGVPGSPTNVHVVTSEDLELAKLLFHGSGTRNRRMGESAS